jgi:hypothetical protein
MERAMPMQASGKKYKECCWQRLQGFDIGKAYDQAIKDNNMERALIATRADTSQLSHRAPCALADFTLQLSSCRFHDASTNEISD